MDKMFHVLSVKETLDALGSDAGSGLSETEAAERLARYGPNILTERETVRWYNMLARQFANFLIVILLIAAGLSYVLGDVIDTLAILLIVILNGLLGFLQEWKAETALKKLQQMLTPHCRVIRGGMIENIDAGKLVPGDLVLLESGNMVPADLRLISAVNLRSDEAILTGESGPVKKDTEPVDGQSPVSDRRCIAWTGTHIINGRAQGLVIATGMETEFGRIAGLTGNIKETQTRLQVQLSQLGRQLAFLAISAAMAIILIGWISGKPPVEMLMAGISLAVAAVPEGLPAVVTITLAIGVSIMARQKAMMRSLQAAETLGATSVICTDKTGTLTKNEMTVQKIWLPGGTVTISGAGYEPTGSFIDSHTGKPIEAQENPELRALLETSSQCNHARIARTEQGWSAIGAPTEAALISAAQKAGVKYDDNPALFEFSFNSARKRMSVIKQNERGTMTAHVKGAPEVLLPLCSHIFRGDEIAVLDQQEREKIAHAYKAFAQEGLRTLALARKTLPDDSKAPDEESVESDMTFLGIVGIIDPPRPEVIDAIEKTKNAGIRVIMITGDSPDTAAAIAKQIGLEIEHALTGADIARLDDAALAEKLEKNILFARTVPEDKYRIVKLLQQQKHVTAMTGDGVNDAPALKQADIGIAMGIRGTDVARGAADMVLSDDNFASIVRAIEEGRRQYANIRKFVRYLTSSNIGETLAVFISIVMGGSLILVPIQILWINLVTDSVTALSLLLEKAEEDVMNKPPRPANQPILDRNALLMLGLFGSYIGIMAFILFQYYLQKGASYELANTAAFTGIVIMANLHTLNFRSLTKPLSSIGWLSNPVLLGAIGAMILLQLGAIYLPVLQTALRTAPLGVQDWLLILGTALPLFLITELYKIIRFRQT